MPDPLDDPNRTTPLGDVMRQVSRDARREQSSEAVSDVAAMAGQYLRDLMAQGFTRMEALQLVREWQYVLFMRGGSK